MSNSEESNRNTRAPRPYQRDCIDFCARAFRETACRVLAIIMPTGAGKTFTVVSLLAQHGDAFGGILVVAPQLTIAEAWRCEAASAGLSDADFRVITHAAALNLTADELGALEGRLLVVDEAHHARDYEEDSTGIGAFANYWHAHGGTVLFVTATPFMNGSPSLPHGTVCWSRSIAEHAQPDPTTDEQYMPGRVRMAVVYLPVEDMDDEDFVEAVVSGWVERWRIDGRQKAVFIAPSHLPGGSRRFADALIDALGADSPGLRVQDCVGASKTVQRDTLAVIAREAQLARYADSGVDVMVSAARFNEGTDWKFASAVYRYGVPGSFTLGMQQAGRAFRKKPDDHPEREVATYCCLVPMLPDDPIAAWERYHRDMVGLLVAHLENGETGQAYISVVQKPVLRGSEEPDASGADRGQELGEGENQRRSRTKLRKRTIVRPDLREKLDAAFSVYLYEDPEFMRVRREVQAGMVTGTSAQRMEQLLRAQLDAGKEVRWSGARWRPKTEEERAARSAKHAAIEAARTPEQRAALSEKRAATWAARTPEQRAARVAKIASTKAAYTPEQRAAIEAKKAKTVAARTPEQRAALAAKMVAAHAARTPEQRAASTAKRVVIAATRTPEQWAAREAKIAATRATHTPEQKAAIVAKIAATKAAYTPEQRAEYVAKLKAAWAARTPDQRAAHEAKRAAARAALTPEQRAEYVAKLKAAWAARTPDQRAASAAKNAATRSARTPEQQAALAARLSAANAARTPEQRAAIAAKKAATRAKRAAERAASEAGGPSAGTGSERA